MKYFWGIVMSLMILLIWHCEYKRDIVRKNLHKYTTTVMIGNQWQATTRVPVLNITASASHISKSVAIDISARIASNKIFVLKQNLSEYFNYPEDDLIPQYKEMVNFINSLYIPPKKPVEPSWMGVEKK